jgi:cytoskeletal protein RodZ
MNKLLGLNRRVLDVNGRLSLLGPTKDVRQILERAGLHNFIKIYDNEDELVRSSDEIVKQTTTFSLSDLRRYREQMNQPQSEFEDLRSELGKAFGSDEEAAQSSGSGDGQFDFGSQQPQQAAAPPPPPPPPPPQQQPQAPQYGPPPQQQPQQSYGPPPGGGYGPAGAQQQQQPSYGQPAAPQRPSPGGRADRYDEDLFEEKKHSAMPAVLGILFAILVFAGGGAALYFTGVLEDLVPGLLPQARQQQVTQPEQVPQLAVEAEETGSQEESASEQETDEEEEVEEAQKRPAPKQVARSTRRQTSRPRRRSRPSRSVSRTPPPAPKVRNKLTVTSEPNGATVTIDGRTMGTTPYTWDNPSVYGTVIVGVDQTGYEQAEKRIDYTGGRKKEHFVLAKAASRPSAPAASTPSRTQSAPSQAQSPAPRPSTPATSSSSASSAAAQSSPAPSVAAASPAPSSASAPSSQPEPAAPTPAPTASAAPAPSAGGGGDPATIFIASIPPVADVYMDGKKIGQTNIAELKVSSGSHTMRFVKGAKEVTKQMTFSPGKNPSQMVKIP